MHFNITLLYNIDIILGIPWLKAADLDILFLKEEIRWRKPKEGLLAEPLEGEFTPQTVVIIFTEYYQDIIIILRESL